MDWFERVHVAIREVHCYRISTTYSLPPGHSPPWATAITNGAVIVATDRKEPGACSDPDSRVVRICEFLGGAPTGGETIRLEEFRLFAGGNRRESSADCPECKGTGKRRCPECNGTGTTECVCARCDNEKKAVCDHCDRSLSCLVRSVPGDNEHEAVCDHCEEGIAECNACDGTGKEGASRAQRPAWIGGTVVDLTLAACFIHDVPGETCLMSVGGPETPVWFQGAGWIVAIMPMRPESAGKDAPRWTTAEPAWANGTPGSNTQP